MNLITPSLGLIVWQMIIFIILLVFLGKFAWKPIMQFIEQREEDIRSSLEMAKQAREEMYFVQANRDRLLKEAWRERDAILKEVHQIKDKIQAEAQESAQAESDKMIEQARRAIENERIAAIVVLKNQVADISLSIAEKILKKELAHKDQQQQFLKELVNELK
ncbi:MAG: F0F1 ATP synthase subunit B [Flavobacteriales bacterium AspAUS03]